MKRWRTTPGRAAHKRGFSLVEVLVALSLLAVLMAFLFGSLSFGRRALQMSAQTERAASVAAVQLALENLLSRTEPLLIAGANRRRKLVFEGRSDRLAFVANLEGRTTLAGLYVVEILAAPESDGRTVSSLHLTQTLFRLRSAENVGGLPSYRRTLLTEIDSLTFRYFGPGGSSHDEWLDEWIDRSELPKLVEMRVQFRRGDPRLWVPLVIALKLGRQN